MRLMGLDIGSKRIGVAISDELGITSQPLTTLPAGKLPDFLAALRRLVDDYQVGAIVIGLPRHMNGDLGEGGEEVLKLGERIRQYLQLPVFYWDERLSTVAAERTLLEGDVRRGRRRQVIDRLAASWILGGYLEWQQRNKGRDRQPDQ